MAATSAPGTLPAEEVAERHPPRPADRERAARHRRPPEAGHAPVAEQVGDEDLAAPERPVVAHPEPVVGDADVRLGEAVLGGARGDVGVVVLDRDPALGRVSPDGVLRREVLGMEVVHHDLRLDGEESREVGEAVREGPVGRQVLQVAVVRRDVGPPAAGERERVLELRADGEQRTRRRDREPQRLRSVAAAAPDDRRPTGHDARHRVVVAGPDLAVVEQERRRRGRPAAPRRRRRRWRAARRRGSRT